MVAGRSRKHRVIQAGSFTLWALHMATLGWRCLQGGAIPWIRLYFRIQGLWDLQTSPGIDCSLKSRRQPPRMQIHVLWVKWMVCGAREAAQLVNLWESLWGVKDKVEPDAHWASAMAPRLSLQKRSLWNDNDAILLSYPLLPHFWEFLVSEVFPFLPTVLLP